MPSTILTSASGTPIHRSVDITISLGTVSNAFSRSTNPRDIDCPVPSVSSLTSLSERTSLDIELEGKKLTQRGAVVLWLARSLITRPARVQVPDQEARIIRCKNLALYIRDCVSLCLSDDTLKSRWSFLYMVSMPGEVKRGKLCVTCRGLHILA